MCKELFCMRWNQISIQYWPIQKFGSESVSGSKKKYRNILVLNAKYDPVLLVSATHCPKHGVQSGCHLASTFSLDVWCRPLSDICMAMWLKVL